MTQTRTVHQAKVTRVEAIALFRNIIITALGDAGVNLDDVDATNLSWRGSIDGGIVITIDPAWPE